ncbi:MAG TPA: TonB family protein [Chthoniobacterales bacterium]|nr:TonB family protein [Chthoniobacterales bacterium]
MSQQRHISRYAASGAFVAVLLFFGASTVQAQWAAKPAPVLPRSVLDQATSGSVVLNLVFARDGHVTDAQLVRSSGVSGLDRLAVEGAMKWRLDPSAVTYADQSGGRQHLIKFFQDARVSRRVEPFQAFWREL